MKASARSSQSPLSLYEWLAHHAAATPDERALCHEGHAWSYETLHREAQARGAALQGSCRLVLGGDSLTLALGAYAASARGIAFLPLAPNGTSAAASPAASARAEEPPTAPSVDALLIATSGSEGRSRIVRLGVSQLDAAAQSANALLGLRPGDCWLNCLPLYHIGGQSLLWRCARAGATLLLHDGFSAQRVADDLAREPVTHISLVPAMLARLLEAGSPPPPALRAVLIGGAALSADLYRRAGEDGWPLYVSYGMSETAALIAAHGPEDGPWREGLAGRPLPGHAARIAPDGRIRLHGPQIMAGYLDGGGIDADGWLTTGDLGRIDAAGRLTLLGRADDMLISGGQNIHPQAIESCLAACPGLADIAVTGRPDPVWGDLVVALFVGQASAEAVLEYARRHLPSPARPRHVRRLPALPRNAAGKLDRAALRRLAEESGA